MKQLIILLLTALIGLGSYAQDRIDRVIADLESKNDVETTYSERRTAKKHKLYRITTVLNFNKDEYYKRLAKAFEDEREKAVSAVKTRTSHSYRFTDDKGTSTYTLTRNSIVKSWRSNEDKSDDESNVETIVDPNGNTLVTITTNNKHGEKKPAWHEMWHGPKHGWHGKPPGRSARLLAKKHGLPAKSHDSSARLRAKKRRLPATPHAAFSMM